MTDITENIPAVPANAYPKNVPVSRSSAYGNQLGWIIALLAIIAICAIIVAWNVVELDVFIKHLQDSFNNSLNTSGF
jgi:hypothetical protein